MPSPLPSPSPSPAPAPAPAPACTDTAGWDNQWTNQGLYTTSTPSTAGPFTCADYVNRGWCCGQGACAQSGWTLGSGYNHPELHCCACGAPANRRRRRRKVRALKNSEQGRVKQSGGWWGSPEQDEGGIPEPMSEADWEREQEAERKEERKEMKHNGTKWHMPVSTSDCVLGPNGEVKPSNGCREWPAQAAAL